MIFKKPKIEVIPDKYPNPNGIILDEAKSIIDKFIYEKVENIVKNLYKEVVDGYLKGTTDNYEFYEMMKNVPNDKVAEYLYLETKRIISWLGEKE